MKSNNRIIDLDKKICTLREELDSLVGNCIVDSDRVLKLSRELDVLILRYYSQEDNASV